MLLFLLQLPNFSIVCEMYKYFKINRPTILSLYKVLGAYCTGAAALLFIVTKFELTSVSDVFYLFLTCLIVGHIFAFSLVLMYLSVNYELFKEKIRFFEQIKAEIKEAFKIILYEVPIHEKYGLAELRIYCLWQNHLFVLMPSRENKEVGISVLNILDEADFERLTRYIEKQYKPEAICMSGFGIRKAIKLNDWNLFGIDDIAGIFKELVDLSATEKIEVVKFEDRNEE